MGNANLSLSSSEVSLLKKKLDHILLVSNIKSEKKIIQNILEKLDPNYQTTLFIDGAALPNNEGAGIGGICYKNGIKLFTFAKHIGGKTNNEAEYSALIYGLEKAIDLGIKDINIFSDSELIVKQINGEYKVKNERMKIKFRKSISILSKYDHWELTHIPREKNMEADALSKKGLKDY
jgi:ribonuclease HI